VNLPHLVFFAPTQSFIEWLRAQCRVYDVGAGVGLLGTFSDAVTCIDLFERDNPLGPVEIADGTCYPYEPGSIVLVCRPCHGHFIEGVCSQARSCGCDFYYCGLPRNYDGDLGDWQYQVVLEQAGSEGEQLLMVRPESEDER
jgi:hypothetical protein